MRHLPSLILALLLCGLSAVVAAQHPVPPGVREADKRQDIPMDPPRVAKRRAADPALLKQQAEELARLAATIPSQVESASRGRLPRDLSRQLKQIEKLAKKLRSEVSP